MLVLLVFIAPVILKEWADISCSDQQLCIAVTWQILKWREAGRVHVACCSVDRGRKLVKTFENIQLAIKIFPVMLLSLGAEKTFLSNLMAYLLWTLLTPIALEDKSVSWSWLLMYPLRSLLVKYEMFAMLASTAELPLVPVIAGYHWWNSALCELHVLWESRAVERPKSRY